MLALGFVSGGKAHAATPPDACFNFNSGTGTIEDYYDNEDNDGSNPACTKNVDIPSTIASTAVTAIGDNSFSGKQLTSVTIPSSVLTIGGSSFHTNNLSSLTLGNSVTTIADMAFYNNQLTSVTIPSSVTTIGSFAFEVNQLTSVIISNSVVSIGNGAFQGNQLTTLTIPDSVISIGNEAFRGNDLTSLTLGNSVVTIGSVAFGENQLTTVIIPDSVIIIADGSFAQNKLTSLVLGNSVTTIGGGAFQSNKLTSVIIPSSVTTIDAYAFIVNSSLDPQILSAMAQSGDPAQVQQAYDSIRLVHLFTVDPSNPNNLQDSIITEADVIGMDLNGNGNQNDILGSHLINPVDTENTVTAHSGSKLASTGQNTTLGVLTALITVALGTALLVRRFNS